MQSHSISATDDNEDDFDSGSSDGDDGDDKSIRLSRDPVLWSQILWFWKRKLICYKSDFQKVVSYKGYVSWEGNGKSHSSLHGEAIWTQSLRL